MSVEIGTEAAQFPEKKYINGIFIAVHDLFSSLLVACVVGFADNWQVQFETYIYLVEVNLILHFLGDMANNLFTVSTEEYHRGGAHQSKAEQILHRSKSYVVFCS
jgi:hypothetical protein